jgi:hypothetical protein
MLKLRRGLQSRDTHYRRWRWQAYLGVNGGGGGIRTHGGVAPTTVFETVPIVHSGTPPREINLCQVVSWRNPLKNKSKSSLTLSARTPFVTST